MNLFREHSCRRCKAVTEQELVNFDATAAEPRFAWWCSQCRWLSEPGMWILKQKVIDGGMNLDAIREIHTKTGERCAKCWNRPAELHHWAPKFLFGSEADSWPTDFLCKHCHDEWHRLVTPGIRGPKAIAR